MKFLVNAKIANLPSNIVRKIIHSAVSFYIEEHYSDIHPEYATLSNEETSDWQFEITDFPCEPEQPQPVIVKQLWDVELMYKLWHKQSPTMISLEQIECAERAKAEQEARLKGSAWLEDTFKKNEVQEWDVKARPAKK